VPDSIDEVIDSLIRREGGYVDNPSDRGGPTNFGITAAELGQWRNLGRRATRDEVSGLKEVEARAIYRSDYVERPGFSQIADEPLRELLVDCAVNHQPERAVKWLQAALGVKVDGWFGPKTLAAVRASYSWAVYYGVLATRARFYGYIISHNHSQAVFAAGWMNRLAEFVERSEP